MIVQNEKLVNIYIKIEELDFHQNAITRLPKSDVKENI